MITGLVRDFKQKNHRFVGDCVVGTESLVGFSYYEDFMKVLKQADFIEGLSAAIKNYALINPKGSQRSVGVEIMGIDPVRHSEATGFGETLHYSKSDVSRTFKPSYDPNLAGCVVGIDLWLGRDAKGQYTYAAKPERQALGVSCFPLTPKGALAKAGAGEVNTKTFYYSDTSHSGLARVDSSFVYLPFEQAFCQGKRGGAARYGKGTKLEGLPTPIYRSNGKRANNAYRNVCACGRYDSFYCACSFLYDYQP